VVASIESFWFTVVQLPSENAQGNLSGSRA
jgi:hypothetical protein